jgi:hypothetical protein
MHPFGIGLY